MNDLVKVNSENFATTKQIQDVMFANGGRKAVSLGVAQTLNPLSAFFFRKPKTV